MVEDAVNEEECKQIVRQGQEKFEEISLDAACSTYLNARLSLKR